MNICSIPWDELWQFAVQEGEGESPTHDCRQCVNFLTDMQDTLLCLPCDVEPLRFFRSFIWAAASAACFAYSSEKKRT